MKRRLHETYGSCFQIVSPGGVAIYIADADIARELVTRNEAFPKPLEELGVLNVFGINVATTEGAMWKKHRRITTPPFNERNSALVWEESLSQGGGMISYLQAQSAKKFNVPPESTTSVKVEDLMVHTMTLALNVFTYAGFGVSSQFSDAESVPKATPGLSKMGPTLTLRTILENIAIVVAIPPALLRFRFAPELWHRCLAAKEEWFDYAQSLAQQEQSEKARGDTLLTNLLRNARDDETQRGEEKAQGTKLERTRLSAGLDKNEIAGNIFVFSLAGSETSAVTIATAITQLAIYPDMQDWVFDEVQKVYSSRRPEGLEYATTYPQLNRIRALIHESLRLYGPTPEIAKSTNNGPQSLMTPRGPLHIPAGVQIHVNNVAMHLDPVYWGNDVENFRPQRWLSRDTNGKEVPRPDFPAKGAFMPWAGGARICPGQKFSLVEMCAVIVTVLAGWRVEIAKLSPNENSEAAKQRALKANEDRTFRITLQPQNSPALMFVRR
ncbi:MAG: hypothetical protein M4579_003202 [Chaenotheca gracillima]|nr:MAG: hypothetical protein M4579_003202 [Chaenotheca gracillima]